MSTGVGNMLERVAPSAEAGSESPRVAIVAENAWARGGGEPRLPYEYFRRLRARGVEAWLVVHSRCAGDLRTLLPDETDRMIFIPETALERFVIGKLGKFIPARILVVTFGVLLQMLNQRKQRRVVSGLVRDHGVNVVHQPTPVSPKQPSMIHGVGAPVVIGPMNGGMSFPAGFSHLEGRAAPMVVGVARAVSGLFNRLVPGKRRAAMLVVANERTRKALPDGMPCPVVELVENGIDVTLWNPVPESQYAHAGPIRFVTVARLVTWKAIDLLIEAMAKVAADAGARPCELHIVGNGPERASLERLAKELKIDHVVRFHGLVPQAELATRIREFDVFVLPSLYECGGAVVMEAMATALPAIATNWGGPADYLDEQTGILVDPVDRPTFIRSLADAMLRLAGSAETRRAMGTAGRRKTLEMFCWDRKVDRMVELYQRAIREDASRASANVSRHAAGRAGGGM